MLPIALALLAWPQDLPAAPRVERLDNGLRVVIIEERDRPIVSVQLWVHAGSALDESGRPGLAHLVRVLLEHREDAALRIRSAGGRFRAATHRDGLLFSTLIAADLLDPVLAIEARRVQPLVPTPDEVRDAVALARLGCEHERSDAAHDPPGDAPARALLAAAYAGHPYGRAPEAAGGEVVFTPDEVSTFLARWCAPGNATLLIVGDVLAPAALESVRRHFGSVGWRDTPRQPDVPATADGSVGAEVTDAARAGVDFAWVTPPWGFVENAWVRVLMTRLCDERDGPLAARLARLGASPPRWGLCAWRHGGLLWLRVDGAAELHGVIVQAVDQALSGAGSIPAEAAASRPARGDAGADAEIVGLRRARALAAAAYRAATSDPMDRAVGLALQEVLGGDALLEAYELPRIERTNPASLRAAARMLAQGRRVVQRRTPRPAAGAASQATAGRESERAGARLLEAEEALEALAAHAAPPVAAPAPISASGEVINGYAMRGWVTQATGRAAVMATCAGLTPAHVRARLEGSRDGAFDLGAYATLHGFRIAANAGSVLVEGRRDQVEAILEWMTRLAPAAPSGVEGDQAGLAAWDRACRAAAESAADWADLMASHFDALPTPEKVGDPRGGQRVIDRAGRLGLTLVGEYDAVGVREFLGRLPPGPTRGVGPPLEDAAGPVVLWTPIAGDTCELRVVIASAPDADGVSADQLCTLAWLLAADERHGTWLDGRRRWRWRWRPLAPGAVMLSARSAPHAASRALDGLLTRFEDARAGRIPVAQQGVARRMADLRARQAGDLTDVAWYVATGARVTAPAWPSGGPAAPFRVRAVVVAGPWRPPEAWPTSNATRIRIDRPGTP